MNLQIIAEILPLAIAATFSPSGLLFVILIMSSKKGKRGGLLFNLGAILFLILLTLAMNMAFSGLSNVKLSINPYISGAIDIALGLWIVYIFIRNKTNKDSKPAKNISIPPFALGFASMIINVSTIIPYIAANKILLNAHLDIVPYVVSLAILILVTMALMLFPIIISLVMPKKSDHILAIVEKFMSQHGATIARYYFLIIALYLIIKGALQF